MQKGEGWIRDDELLQSLLEEPKEGIRLLTEQYGGLIHTLTWRRLHGKLPKEDIEECVSDIFFELYRCREQIDLERGTLKSFLLVIAKRRATKYYERKVDLFEGVPMGSEEGMSLSAENDVEQEMIQKEESRQLLRAIMDLGEPDGTIMIQKYYYGMTAKEIGRGFGMSKNAVEKRIKRGLEKLRTWLGGDCYEE